MLNAPVDINPKIRGRLTLLAEGELGSPKVSGDGKVVVWDQFVKGNDEIMRWKDGQTQNITSDPHADIFPSVDRRGNVVTWTRFNSLDPDDANGRWEIHEWRNGQERVVAQSKTANLFDNAVSGDGRTVAWDTDGNGSMMHWNIQRQRCGGPMENVTEGNVYSANPHLDYTGRRVIWSDGRTGNPQVWMKDGNGPAHAVAPSQSNQLSPSLSPVGGLVMYADDSSGLDQVTVARNGLSHPLAPAANQDEWLGAESVHGRHAVWSNIDHTQDPSPMELYVKDGDGPAMQLTSSHGGLNSYPTMSDNGRTIVWMWVDPNNTHHDRVYRFDRD